MRAFEFIQELLAQAQQPQQTPSVVINIGNININPAEESEVVDAAEPDTMIPPLQQKIELLKKNAGLDNVYDQQADEDEPLE